MKKDKAREITQDRVQDLLIFATTGAILLWVPPVSHPRDRYDERKLHHYDPWPIRRASAPKRRRWRI